MSSKNHPISALLSTLPSALHSWRIIWVTVGLALLLIALPTPSDAKEIRVVCRSDAGDAARINVAIAGSAAGDEIVIDGPALINRTLKLLGDRSYRGESRTGTVLMQAPGANLTAILASDSFLTNAATTGLPVSLRHLTVDGNKANNTAKTAGIILRSWLTVVEDVQVRQMGGDGIRLTSLSANGTALTNHQVNGRISDCFVTDSGGYGVFVEDPGNACTDWILRDNWIAESGRDGIHLDNAAGWFVDGNHIYGVPGNAIYLDRAFATSVSNNYIEGFGETKAPGTYYGIAVTLQGDVGSSIAGNRIFNFDGEGNTHSKYAYIGIVRVNYKAGSVSVTGNVIGGASGAKSVGLDCAKGDVPGTTLVVTSMGNSIARVGKPMLLGPGVTLSAGL